MAGAGQREVLLASAERLFAERGIDAVSLRAVMAEAGTNVGAINYHFGTKEQLIRELVELRSAEVGRRREPYLVALERDQHPTAGGLAEAFVLPVAELVEEGSRAWVRIVYGILATRHPALALLNQTFAPSASRISDVLHRVDPTAGTPRLRFRLAEAMTTSFRVLGDLDATGRNLSPHGEPMPDAVVVGELLATVSAMLAGPTPRTR